MLASIQRINKVEEHPNADSLELAHVLGYKVVVKKGEFQEGDLCMYVQVDTVLPERPEFEFLEKSKYRVKFVKLRGIVSQGICFPIDVAQKIVTEHYVVNAMASDKWEILDSGDVTLSKDFFREGKDITEYTDVKKYEKPELKHADAAGDFPLHLISKTDESRIENYPRMIEFVQGKEVYVTTKHDGTSFTYINSKDDRWGEMVCSRNMQLKDGDNTYWNMVRKYNLSRIPEGYAVQGEIVGPKIQKNPEGLTEYQLRVFNVKFLEEDRYLDYRELTDFCDEFDLTMVEVLFVGEFDKTYEDLVEMAESTKYNNGKQAEGIVVRLTKPEFYSKIQKDLSFKVISPGYALKHGE